PWEKKAEKFVESGGLVPDEVVIGIVKEKIDQDDLWSGFILDGFPRTIKQAEALEEMLEERNLSLDAVLYFAVDKEEVIKRLSSRRVCENCQATYNLLSNPPLQEGICDRCGGKLVQRDDDKPEVIRQRLETYEKETKPLIDFYEKRNLLYVIPSNGPIEEVYNKVKEVLEEVTAR
ncbi:MAG TPA: nucleoside monophosphate kinase, partial [Candidatus Atribacteria bacterium]|nr:nucleoside monophosphate kinase [Candidatus Atribacteria bacterium]